MPQASYVVSSTINVRILSFLHISSTLQELINKILVNLYLSLPSSHKHSSLVHIYISRWKRLTKTFKPRVDLDKNLPTKIC